LKVDASSAPGRMPPLPIAASRSASPFSSMNTPS